MFAYRNEYGELFRLFKISLLITPSNANVERDFSVLILMLSKQRNLFGPNSIDKIMRLVLLGPQKFYDATPYCFINILFYTTLRCSWVPSFIVLAFEKKKKKKCVSVFFIVVR